MALEDQDLQNQLRRTAKCESVGIGAIIKNQFQIVAYLGRGGMSTVYKALDMSSGRPVALKILHSELLADSTRVQRFTQEAKTYKNLRHDHIIKTYEYFTDESDRYCLVMEYHEGRNLAEVLGDTGRLSIRRAIKVFSEICSALEHAHSQGIVHRDLKPSNITLVEKDNDMDFVKVLDFGIAKLMPKDTETHLGLTQTGEIVGSPLYMSPEQCMAKTIDHRSDIYSLGCLMYESLTGEPPLMGGNVYETFHMQTHERPRALGDVRPEFKGGTQLEFIILKCMAKNPRHRYQTMNDVKQALEQVGTYSACTGLKKLVETWEQRQIRARAAKGKGIPAPIAAGLTAAVIIGTGLLFHERIKQVIIPADQRYNDAVVSYRKNFEAGNYDAARQDGQRALKVAEEERPQRRVQALSGLVDLARITGRKDEAVELSNTIQSTYKDKIAQLDKNERKTLSKLREAANADQEEMDTEQIEELSFQLIDIAQNYVDNQRCDLARSCLKKTQEIAKAALGADSLVSCSLSDNLVLLRLKDNLDENYRNLEDRLTAQIERRERLAGSQSTGLIRTLEALSEVQRRLGKYAEARENAVKALSIARNTFRSNSQQAALTKCQLAEIDLSMKRFKSAGATAGTALIAMDSLKDSDDLEQARCHILIGESKQMKDKFTEATKDFDAARDLLKDASDNQVLLLARALSDQADIVSNISKTRQDEKGFRIAEGYYKRALALMLRSNAREEERVLHILDRLNAIYGEDRQADFMALLQIMEAADLSTGKTKGVIEDKRLMAAYFRDRKELTKAAATLENALTMSQNLYGVKSAESGRILGLLAEVYLNENKGEKAAPLIYEAIQILHSEDEGASMPRKAKVQVLSTYARYLDEVTGDREKLQEVKSELNSV